MSGSRRHSVAEVARLLGISERGVRDRIERGTLDAVKQEGQRGWRILLPPDTAADAVGDAVAPTASGGRGSGSNAVGEAVGGGSSAVVTPLVVEQAIARTGQQYTADLRTMLAELREVYEGQIEAKDAALTAKDETIAELRRRAEAVETERAALLQRAEDAAREARAEDTGILLRLRALQEENVELRRQAVLAELVARSAPVPPGPRAPAPHHDGPPTSGRVAHAGPAQAAQEAPGAPGAPHPAQEAVPGMWRRLRRWWGGAA